MRSSRLFAVATLFVSFGWLLAGGCSASDDSSAAGSNYGGTSTGGSAPGDPTKVTPDASTTGGNALTDLNPLCGVGVAAGTCTPDKAEACRGYTPVLSGSGGAGTGGEGGNGGTGGNGGASTIDFGGTGAIAGDSSSAGGVGGQAGAENASGASSTGGAGEGGMGSVDPQEPAEYGCQVSRQLGMLVRQCERAGAGKVNAPCFNVDDCAAGFACVTEHGAGRCLPYCCSSETTCTSGTYCAERPLRTDVSDTSDPLRVPVCVPADGCSLEEPFPCPSGSNCRCQGETACMVVRDDGTTSCVSPGTGQQGEACPCAWNHICSGTTHQCLKICRTDSNQNDCGAQKCQASSELPQNFGVCVGPLR